MEAVAVMPRPAIATGAARSVSMLGEPAVAGLLAAGLPCLAGPRDSPAMALTAVARLGAGCLVRRVACEVVARPRPPARLWLAEPSGPSFPSRHTTVASLAMLAGAGAYPRSARTAAAGISVAVGLSRVYLGVHWPTDVLAGWLLAAGWLGITRPRPPAHDARPPSAGSLNDGDGSRRSV
jgi:undecaprenyl-diphosphatase